MKERKAATAVMPARYRRAGKKAKRRLRDELPGLSGDIRLVCPRTSSERLIQNPAECTCFPLPASP
jgi:hypothetical protein